MILYHGSTVSVDAPHILESVSLLDFGKSGARLCFRI